MSVDLKDAGNLIYIVGKTYPELGGSEYYKLKGYLGASVPKVKAAKPKSLLKRNQSHRLKAIVKSCHDLSEGGLAVAAAEMAFASGLRLRT